jgi:hypothetical protein
MLPEAWCQSDLEVLVKAGFLTIIDEWQNPDDDWDRKIEYEVSSV